MAASVLKAVVAESPPFVASKSLSSSSLKFPSGRSIGCTLLPLECWLYSAYWSTVSVVIYNGGSKTTHQVLLSAQ